jgi:NAD(P)H-hydrate epimerase
MAIPELMLSVDPSSNAITDLPPLDPYTAIAAGPGLGTSAEAATVLKRLIQESKVPLVLDADALNILAENKTWLAFLPKGTILTPHPGEFARLTGAQLSHYDGIEKQREMSRKYSIYILLKGAHSSLSLPDGQVLINSTGNPGMASAGMGDTLTGIIAGLLGAGYGPMKAAALGMFVHGLAADLAIGHESQESLLASDLIAHLGRAFNQIGYDGA